MSSPITDRTLWKYNVGGCVLHSIQGTLMLVASQVVPSIKVWVVEKKGSRPSPNSRKHIRPPPCTSFPSVLPKDPPPTPFLPEPSTPQYPTMPTTSLPAHSRSLPRTRFLEQAFTKPLTISFLEFDNATKALVPATKPAFDVEIGVCAAVFILLSAVAHGLILLRFNKCK